MGQETDVIQKQEQELHQQYMVIDQQTQQIRIF